MMPLREDSCTVKVYLGRGIKHGTADTLYTGLQ